MKKFALWLGSWWCSESSAMQALILGHLDSVDGHGGTTSRSHSPAPKIKLVSILKGLAVHCITSGNTDRSTRTGSVPFPNTSTLGMASSSTPALLPQMRSTTQVCGGQNRHRPARKICPGSLGTRRS